jgi:hypothetical protein
MISKAKYFLFTILVIMITDVSAQNSQVLYNMNIPQNHLVNPALRPSNSVYIGLPALTGINININNNFFNFSDVFMNDESSDSVLTFLHPDYDIDDFLDKVKNMNSIEPQVTIQLFGLGFSLGRGNYLFLDINERIDANIVLPGDILRLALKGNSVFAGDMIDLSSLRTDMKLYHEIGIGFSRDFTEKLRIGVKGKLLTGVMAASIDNRSLGISVSENYTHTLDADVQVNLSAPLDVYMDEDQNIDSIYFDDSRFEEGSQVAKYFLKSGNRGLGLDIGATYAITPDLVVSAALTDLGFIRWKRDVTNLQAESQFEFSGLNISDVINGDKTFDELGEEMIDSLKNSFIVSDSNDPFTTWLPFGITLGGTYHLNKYFSVGLLSYSRIIGKQFRESLTLSANVNISNILSTSISYTAANSRFDNLGAGLAFRAGIIQFYMMTDRIPVVWNRLKIDEESNIIMPSSLNTINLRLGMNLTFGNKVKKKDDNPMIIVE